MTTHKNYTQTNTHTHEQNHTHTHFHWKNSLKNTLTHGIHQLDKKYTNVHSNLPKQANAHMCMHTTTYTH